MPTPIENVSAFFAAFPEDQGKVAIQRWFTPGTVWVNEGVAVTTGIDKAIALTDELKKTVGIAIVRIEMLAIAADGNKVLTERFDRFERADGSEIGVSLDIENYCTLRSFFVLPGSSTRGQEKH